MGKYIKYFKTAEEFAEYWNFGEFAPGPDDSDTTMVAFVSENDAVYYNNDDLSEFEVSFYAQSPEIDATADTVTFNIKTGSFWLDVYHNGVLVNTYKPAVENNYDYSVDANMTPLTVTENFVGKWYRDNDGEKGDYITEFPQSITHLPDPNADPVKLTIEATSYSLDGAGPIRLGNESLTGATRILMDESGNWEDITSDVYVSNRRLWYDVPGGGSWIFKFEFESENQVVGDYFYQSQLKSIEISTNYPELAAQTNFVLNGPLMQSTIEEVSLGEGMQSVSQGAFMMANSLNYIYAQGDVLPAVSGQFFGLPSNGTFEADSREAENFQNWVNALPSGWEILPEPGPTVTVVGTFITTSNGETVNVPSYDGGDWSYAYIDGDESNILPMGDTSYTFATAGEHTITYVRESDDTYLQNWFNNTDAVRVDASGNAAWGCHGNDYYQSSTSMAFADNTHLTGATFDENCDRIGSSCFSGCTALVYLAFNNPSGVSLNGEVYPFDTITANQGVLHIPSGSQSAYADLITALGNNWSVQDDL